MNSLLIGVMIFAILFLAFADISLIKREVNEDCKKLSFYMPTSKNDILLLICIIAISVLAFLMMHLFYEVSYILIVKKITAITVLWAMAFVDFKSYRIPNRFVVYGLILRVVILCYEIIFIFDESKGFIISELIAVVAVILICFLGALLSKGSIGMGDIKMLIMLATFLGIQGIIYTMTYSVVVAFVVSVFLLVSKKKKKNDPIPFAPFVLTGSILSSILSGV